MAEFRCATIQGLVIGRIIESLANLARCLGGTLQFSTSSLVNDVLDGVSNPARHMPFISSRFFSPGSERAFIACYLCMLWQEQAWSFQSWALYQMRSSSSSQAWEAVGML